MPRASPFSSIWRFSWCSLRMRFGMHSISRFDLRSAQFCCGELIKRHVCTWLLLSPCKKVLLFFVLPYGFWWSLLRISATRLMHEMEGCPYLCTKVLNFSQIIPFVCKCNLFACVFPMGTEEQGIEFVFQKQKFFSINVHSLSH